MSQYPPSQYPPPYSPQQPAYGGYRPPQPPRSPEELLAPARRAGTLMIVIGALSVLCGLWIAWQSSAFDPAAPGVPPEFQRQMQQQIETFESQSGMSFRTLLLVMGVAPLAVGAVLGGLGLYVRGGSFGVVITAAILTGALLLVVGLVLLAGLLQSAAMGGAVVALGVACQCGVPFALLAVLMVWLVQAARAASQITLARQNYQAQMWHYQQYQQAYLQQGQPPQGYPPESMGYGYPPPPPPPAPAPPPSGPPAESKDPPDGTSPQG